MLLYEFLKKAIKGVMFQNKTKINNEIFEESQKNININIDKDIAKKVHKEMTNHTVEWITNLNKVGKKYPSNKEECKIAIINQLAGACKVLNEKNPEEIAINLFGILMIGKNIGSKEFKISINNPNNNITINKFDEKLSNYIG